MPLTFVNHEPPELMQELRALWQKADELGKRTQEIEAVGALGPPAPAVTVVGDGYMRAFWAQLSMQQAGVPIVTISEGYTILDVWLFVVSRPAAGPTTFTGRVYSTGSFLDYVGDGTTVIGSDPTFATWGYHNGIPRRPAVQISAVDGYQRVPIYPATPHALRIGIESDWPPGLVSCYHAVIFGTYLLHPMAYFPGNCP